MKGEATRARAADAPGFLERCSFHVVERLGKLWAAARRVDASVLMWSYVCAVIAGQMLYELLDFVPKVFYGILLLASVPFQVAYCLSTFLINNLWRRARRVIPSAPLTDAQLHSLLDRMRAGPPPRSNAMLVLMLKDFQKEAPRWRWGVANGCTRAEVYRMLVLLRDEICRSARLVRFVPSPLPLPPPRTPSPPPRPPSPPPDPGVSHANGRSGSPQREYPYQTEPAQRKHQWYGTNAYKPPKKGRRQPAPDQSNREADKEASLQRVKERKAAQAEERKRLEAEEAERHRNLDIGRYINREERGRGNRPVPRSSLTGISENKPTHCTLAQRLPEELITTTKPRDDDAVSVAESVRTNDVPTPHTLHSEARRVQRGRTNYEVQCSLKHGEVIPGNDENEHVHLPSREGDPKVVTANTDDGFVIKTII